MSIDGTASVFSFHLKICSPSHALLHRYPALSVYAVLICHLTKRPKRLAVARGKKRREPHGTDRTSKEHSRVAKACKCTNSG